MNKEDIISSGELRNISRLRSDDMDDMKYGFDFNHIGSVRVVYRYFRNNGSTACIASYYEPNKEEDSFVYSSISFVKGYIKNFNILKAIAFFRLVYSLHKENIIEGDVESYCATDALFDYYKHQIFKDGITCPNYTKQTVYEIISSAVLGKAFVNHYKHSPIRTLVIDSIFKYSNKFPRAFKKKNSFYDCQIQSNNGYPVTTFTDENFKSLTSRGTWVVYFHDSLCKTSKKVISSLEKLKSKYPGVRFGNFDASACPKSAKDYIIEDVPVLCVSKNGKNISAMVGTVPVLAIELMIKSTVFDEGEIK